MTHICINNLCLQVKNKICMKYGFVAKRRLTVYHDDNQIKFAQIKALISGLGNCDDCDINSCHLFCSLIKESDAYYGCSVFKVPILSLTHTHTHRRVASHAHTYIHILCTKQIDRIDRRQSGGYIIPLFSHTREGERVCESYSFSLHLGVSCCWFLQLFCNYVKAQQNLCILTVLHVTYLYSCLWFHCFDKGIACTCQKRSHF